MGATKRAHAHFLDDFVFWKFGKILFHSLEGAAPLSAAIEYLDFSLVVDKFEIYILVHYNIVPRNMDVLH